MEIEFLRLSNFEWKVQKVDTFEKGFDLKKNEKTN